MTTTFTADNRNVPDRVSAAAAVDAPPDQAGDHRRSGSAGWGVDRATVADRTRYGELAAHSSGTATAEELLRRRAGLPAGHSGRVQLRVRAIEAGLPMARRLACRYRGRGEPLDDLYQVAALALVKAVDGYDPARQVAFISYAVPTIVGALKRHFRDSTWRVRVPRRIQELAISLGPAHATLTQRLGRTPSVVELARYVNAALDDVAIALNARRFHRPESLDTLSAPGEEPPRPLLDVIGSVDARFDAVTDWHLLRPLLAALPDRERRIVALRFFADLTQAEIAVTLGVSQMHISRLLFRTLTQLRTRMLAKPSPANHRRSSQPAVRRR